MANDFLTLIMTRRSIRAYKPDAVPADVLARVLEAGTYAPSAMGAQSAMIVAAVSAEARARLTELNAAVIGKDTDPYYGAPVIVVVLGDGGSANYMADGSCVLENLMLAAHAEGLGSVWVNREREIFDSPDGKALLRDWGLPETLRGVGAIALGYAAGPAPEAAPRKADYIRYVWKRREKTPAFPLVGKTGVCCVYRLLRHDARAALAAHGGRCLRERGDDGAPPPAAAHELHGSGDLRLHRARAELPLAQVALRVVGVQHVKRALLRRAEIQADVVDRREDEQIVRAHGLGQTGTGKVLVDDGVDPEIVPVRVARDRHTAAAAGDDDILIVEQVQDRAPLDDVHRLRRGDDTPPAAPGILAHMQGRVAVLHPLCRCRVVKRADGLCRRTKRGIVRVDDDLRDDRRHLPRHTLRTQRTAQPLLQMIADIP